MLALRGLTRRFGDVRALEDLSFEVQRGQMHGFVGPNGAGKTTTMRIVLGVLEADLGKVSWEGAAVGTAARQGFGYMPEERGLYPKMRVRDQLVYMARLHGIGAADALAAADAWLDRLGLSNRAETRLEELSLGNQQRVQLGVALVHKPDLLVLDEPFSGLDPGGVDVLADVLADRAAQGAAVLFSSHQLELVERLCSAVSIIKNGRLVASGDVAELRAHHGASALHVRVEGAAEDWWRTAPGVTDGRATEGLVILTLAEGADDQQVLAAASDAGRVTHFGHADPRLSDIFREAVAA